MRIGRIQNKYTAEGFDLVKSQGLDFIEICCNLDEDVERLVAAKEDVKAQIKRTGIDVSSVGRWNHDVQENGAINEEKFQRYIRLLDTAIELGAKTFVCGCNKDDSVSLFRNYENAISMFRRIIEHADGRIKVAVENCCWNNFINKPEQWKVVLDELPELCIKFDPSHAYNRNLDYLEQLSDWGERIAHVHVKGAVHAGKRYVDDPPAGMDDINWGSVMAVLYARGYNGDLSIEPHSATWHGELGYAGVIFTRDHIKKFII